MAWRLIDKDGDEAIKFEYGKWDSVMGYWCKLCSCFVLQPVHAERHENAHVDNGEWATCS